jgi:hypothetical protein
MATLGGFQNFVQTAMGIPTSVLPSSDPSISLAYDLALYYAPTGLQCVPPGAPLANPADDLYSLCVYNLAGANLILFGADPISGGSNPTFFQTTRAGYNLNGFTAGTVNAASDESTSGSFTAAEWASQLTIDQLQLLKTPWGQAALALMQNSSFIWGIA